MPAAFFAIAFLYSNAGFGGGSSYLALLALAGLPSDEMRTAGLLCNVVVVGLGTLLYLRHKHLPKRSWPLLVLSVPAAFVTGRFQLNDEVFYPLLAVVLMLAALAMLWQAWVKRPADKPVDAPAWFPFLTGWAIGGLSGLVGIGGGIFLSPLLHMVRWAKALEIAAVASAFILVNSLAGLAGRATSGHWVLPEGVWMLLAAAAIGAASGNATSRRWANPHLLRTITALLILLVGVRLLWV